MNPFRIISVGCTHDIWITAGDEIEILDNFNPWGGCNCKQRSESLSVLESRKLAQLYEFQNFRIPELGMHEKRECSGAAGGPLYYYPEGSEGYCYALSPSLSLSLLTQMYRRGHPCQSHVAASKIRKMLLRSLSTWKF